MDSFAVLKAFSDSCVHVITEFFPPVTRRDSGLVNSDVLGMNLWQKLSVPKKLLSWVTVVGFGKLWIVSSLS